MNNKVLCEILRKIKNDKFNSLEDSGLSSDQRLALALDLTNDGYVEGVIFGSDKNGTPVIANMTRAHLTKKGEAFLENV